jgi:hypothetical protein
MKYTKYTRIRTAALQAVEESNRAEDLHNAATPSFVLLGRRSLVQAAVLANSDASVLLRITELAAQAKPADDGTSISD